MNFTVKGVIMGRSRQKKPCGMTYGDGRSLRGNAKEFGLAFLIKRIEKPS
jgi:hypothetical protein